MTDVRTGTGLRVLPGTLRSSRRDASVMTETPECTATAAFKSLACYGIVSPAPAQLRGFSVVKPVSFALDALESPRRDAWVMTRLVCRGGAIAAAAGGVDGSPTGWLPSRLGAPQLCTLAGVLA